jgi:hypothetical protein
LRFFPDPDAAATGSFDEHPTTVGRARMDGRIAECNVSFGTVIPLWLDGLRI